MARELPSTMIEMLVLKAGPVDLFPLDEVR